MRFLRAKTLVIASLFASWTSVGLAYEDEEDDSIPTPPPVTDSRKPDPVAVPPARDKVPASLIQLGQGQFFSRYAFVMDKSTRTLSVWQNQDGAPTLVTAVPADFGRNSGDKTATGDHRTPEGIYFFLEMKEGPDLNFDEYGVRAFTMDYPNHFDQRDGKSGSGIWLHAIPDTKSLWRGSRGCVVVRNDVIKDLSQYITTPKTPIIVEEKVKYLSVSEHRSEQAKWQRWLEEWRGHWQNKKIEAYINFYGPDFRSLGMNLKQWRSFKSGLNDKYEFIRVGLLEPVIFRHDQRVMIRFFQDYQSDKNADFGEKSLYVTSDSLNQGKIIGEEWIERSRDGYLANRDRASAPKN